MTYVYYNKFFCLKKDTIGWNTWLIVTIILLFVIINYSQL